MRAKSTTSKYGTVAILLHWVTAAAIIALVASGFKAASLSDANAKVSLLRIHALLGGSVLFLTLARIAWWLFFDDKPASLPSTRLQHWIATAVHAFFYVIILGVAASGIGMLALSGAGEILFGSASGPLPDFWNYAPRLPHGVGGRVLIGLFILHAAGALYHQFVLRDRILSRMGLGRMK